MREQQGQWAKAQTSTKRHFFVTDFKLVLRVRDDQKTGQGKRQTITKITKKTTIKQSQDKCKDNDKGKNKDNPNRQTDNDKSKHKGKHSKQTEQSSTEQNRTSTKATTAGRSNCC